MTPYASGELHPTRPPAAQVSAAIALLDRAWGRPHQALEVGISRASLEDMSNAEFAPPKQRDELAPLQSIELHLLPQPTLGQHIALVRIKSGACCAGKFNPANVSKVPNRVAGDRVQSSAHVRTASKT